MSDQPSSLGGFKINSKWHGIINDAALARAASLPSGLVVAFRAPSISPQPQHPREQEPPRPSSLILFWLTGAQGATEKTEGKGKKVSLGRKRKISEEEVRMQLATASVTP